MFSREKERKKAGSPASRQPGYLSETRGFPSSAHAEFGFIRSMCCNSAFPGNPAFFSSSKRPVAFRPQLTLSLALSGVCVAIM